MNFKNLALVGGLLVCTAAAAAPANAYDYWSTYHYSPYRSSYVNVNPYPVVRPYGYYSGFTPRYYDGYHTYYNGGLGMYYPTSRGERIAGKVLDMIF